MVYIPDYLKKVREVTITEQELIDFETEIKESYDSGEIRAPIHLSKGNERQLIEIFQYVHKDDWVFSSWRNHYHALLHGYPHRELMDDIICGESMSTNYINPNFYSSAIVGGIIPLALGVSMGLKRKNSDRRVWCFIGDMTFHTGVFSESYKYAKNFKLPLQFVVEDNNLSVHTPTDVTWGDTVRVSNDVVYYKYKMIYPHHGTGSWVNF